MRACCRLLFKSSSSSVLIVRLSAPGWLCKRTKTKEWQSIAFRWLIGRWRTSENRAKAIVADRAWTGETARHAHRGRGWVAMRLSGADPNLGGRWETSLARSGARASVPLSVGSPHSTATAPGSQGHGLLALATAYGALETRPTVVGCRLAMARAKGERGRRLLLRSYSSSSRSFRLFAVSSRAGFYLPVPSLLPVSSSPLLPPSFSSWSSPKSFGSDALNDFADAFHLTSSFLRSLRLDPQSLFLPGRPCSFASPWPRLPFALHRFAPSSHATCKLVRQ